MKVFTAHYSASSRFVIPKDVFLLYDGIDHWIDNATDKAVKKVGTWWIKWDTFYYIDKDGKQQQIKAQPDEGERKWPDSVSEDEEDTEDESDS